MSIQAAPMDTGEFFLKEEDITLKGRYVEKVREGRRKKGENRYNHRTLYKCVKFSGNI